MTLPTSSSWQLGSWRSPQAAVGNLGHDAPARGISNINVLHALHAVALELSRISGPSDCSILLEMDLTVCQESYCYYYHHTRLLIIQRFEYIHDYYNYLQWLNTFEVIITAHFISFELQWCIYCVPDSHYSMATSEISISIDYVRMWEIGGGWTWRSKGAKV